jgi:glutamate formiminotransferase
VPILTVPNWSIGRERSVIREAIDTLESSPVKVHFAEADIDHNRTVTAFSGTPENVQSTLLTLAEIFLPCINLQRHTGVHPRIGGLDVCPFIELPIEKPPLRVNGEGVGGEVIDRNLQEFIHQTAQALAEAHKIPIFLYERSARGRSLPALRKGGFGSLTGKTLNPDFGPNQAHPHLGATVLGLREPLIALNVNFPFTSGAKEVVERIAALIRHKRSEKDPNFAGVRALGFELQAQELAQVSLNITQPDQTNLDDIIRFINEQARTAGLEQGYTQLIGVIRDVDVERSVLLHARTEQIVSTRQATHWKEDWPNP